MHGRPYIVEYLDARPIYSSDAQTNEYMNTVDEWVRYEILRRQFKPTKESYAEIFNELCDGMKLSRNMTAQEKAKRLGILLAKPLKEQQMNDKLGRKLASLETLIRRK